MFHKYNYELLKLFLNKNAENFQNWETFILILMKHSNNGVKSIIRIGCILMPINLFL